MTLTSTRRALLALALFLCLPAWPVHAQEIDLDFAPEHADGMPRHDLDADIDAIVREILQSPAAAKESIHDRFGEEFVAELLRVLAGWKDPEADRAYGRLMEWNLELFFEYGNMQNRFVRTVVALEGPGAARVRADLALEVLAALEASPSDAAKVEGAEYLTELLGGAEGARMVMYLEARSNRDRVRPLLAHVLIYDAVDGRQAVGEMLAQASHQAALRLKGGEHFADEEVGRAQARMLGRTLGRVDLALEDWAETQDEGPRATAAHGAGIVRFFLGGVDALTGGLSKVVTGPIGFAVDRLEEYETSQEEPPPDPTEELREQMIEAVVAPLKVVTEDLSLQEEEIQVIVETFRGNVEAGRESATTG